jgi:hypothetical protein
MLVILKHPDVTSADGADIPARHAGRGAKAFPAKLVGPADEQQDGPFVIPPTPVMERCNFLAPVAAPRLFAIIQKSLPELMV